MILKWGMSVITFNIKLQTIGLMPVKKLAILLFVLILPLLVYADDNTKQQPFLLHKGAAGRLKLGMSKQELYEHFDEKLTKLIDLKIEEHYCPAIAIYLDKERMENNQQPNLIAEITQKDDWTVWRIRVYDKRFRTKEGIGIGSTYGELKSAYVDKYSFGWSALKEGTICLRVIKELKLHFEFNGWFTKERRDSIPDSTKFESVVVH